MNGDTVPFWKQDRDVLEQRQLHRLKELDAEDAASSNALDQQETRILIHMIAKVAFGALVLLVVSYQAIQFRNSYDTRTRATLSTPIATAIEAEDMELTGNVVVIEDDDATGGKYIVFQ